MNREPNQISSDLPNKKLKPESLFPNNIEFFSKHESRSRGPANIMSFQAELLDIRNIITVNNAELISRHQETALKTAKIPDISILKAGSEKTRQRFKKARSISKKASNMRKGDEDLWVAFIKKKVFRGWGSSQKPKRPIDYFCLTGGVAMNGPSVQWNEAARHRDCPAKDVLTVPKPDIYFAIQIYENLPEPSRFSNQALQNFTFDVLNSCQDLHYSPSKRCVQPTEDYDKHQVCFPFIVIEVKHEDVTKTEVQHCYCQAANAASCALSMLCNLNQHNPSARYWHADQHKILPTVTFTFIGHNVKFWLAYITDYAPTEDKDHKHRYRMECIWSGDMCELWDAVQLCSIVDKVSEWFFYIYRPWISTCLDQWKASEADKRPKMAYESFLHSKGLSQVTLGATAGINSDGAAQLSAAPFTPSSLPYREPSEDVPPTSFGRSHSGSSGPGSTEDAPDLSMLGLRQSRSIWQQSNLNSGTTSKSRFFDRTSSTFGEENSMFSEKPSTEGSSSSPTLKENDRPSSKVDKTPSSCDSGTSARVFNFTPSKRLCSGHAFGSTYSKCDERSCILSSWSSFRGLSSSPATKSGERPSAGASKPKERPSTAGSVSPSSANDERPSTRDSDSPQTDGAPFPRSMLNPSAPKNTGNPLSGKLSGDTSLSPRSRNERQPSNSSSSASISSEDNGSPSSIGTLDLRSLEDVEPFDRSEASLIGRDENGNPGSEAARAGYYYRIR